MAGASFGGKPITTNTEFDPSKDKVTPRLRALNLGGMDSPGALAGTTGVNVELVHGECFSRVTGDVTELITGDHTYNLTGNYNGFISEESVEYIVGNHDYSVMADLNMYVRGATTQEHTGRHIKTNTGALTEKFVGPVDRTYESTTKEEHPEEWYEKVFRKYHFEPWKYESFGLLTTACAFKVDITGAGLCIRAKGLGIGAEEGEYKLTKYGLVNSEEELRTFVMEESALQAHLGMMDVGTPFKPNALPRPTPITPLD